MMMMMMNDGYDDDGCVYLHITVYYNNHEKSEFWINWLVKSRFSQQRPVFKIFFNAAAKLCYCNIKSKKVFSERGKYTLYMTLQSKRYYENKYNQKGIILISDKSCCTMAIILIKQKSFVLLIIQKYNQCPIMKRTIKWTVTTTI